MYPIDYHEVISQRKSALGLGIGEMDVILAVDGERVSTLTQLFRAVWALGAVGVTVPLTIARDGRAMRCDIESADRNDFLRKPVLH